MNLCFHFWKAYTPNSKNGNFGTKKKQKMASKKLARKKVGKIEKKNAKSWLAKVANFPTSVRGYQVKLRPLELWNSLQQGGEVV